MATEERTEEGGRLEPPALVFSRRDRILAALRSEIDRETHDGGTPSADALARAAESVLAVLPPGCRYDAVFRSLVGPAGPVTDSTAPALGRLSWAMAADTASLRRGDAVVPGRIGAEPVAGVVQIRAASRFPERRFRDRGGSGSSGKREAAARYRGLLIVGPGAPADVAWTWSLRFAGYAASRPDGFGFAGRRPAYRSDGTTRSVGRLYNHYAALVGMRFVAELSAPDGRVHLGSVRCPEGLREWNRQLIEMRHRTTFSCPFAFTHPCHDCPKGQTSCPAACRTADLVETVCDKCGRTFPRDLDWEPTCPKCR